LSHATHIWLVLVLVGAVAKVAGLL